MFLKRKKGQAMVEAALVLPIIILVFCGIIDFGWIFGNQILANNAAREAARYCAIHYSQSTPANIKISAAAIVAEKAPTLDYSTVDAFKLGDSVSVTVETNINGLTPFVSISYNVKAKSIMRIEE